MYPLSLSQTLDIVRAEEESPAATQQESIGELVDQIWPRDGICLDDEDDHREIAVG